jgi:hypothetical protein
VDRGLNGLANADADVSSLLRLWDPRNGGSRNGNQRARKVRHGHDDQFALHPLSDCFEI